MLILSKVKRIFYCGSDDKILFCDHSLRNQKETTREKWMDGNQVAKIMEIKE